MSDAGEWRIAAEKLCERLHGRHEGAELGAKMNKPMQYGTLCLWNLAPVAKDVKVCVVGLANTELPVCGIGYVVEILQPSKIRNYDYTHIVANEINLTEL